MKLDKKTLWVRLAAVVAILTLVNLIASYIYTRFDMTTEKRYSLSPATKNLLSHLKSKAYIKVYLDGSLPSGFLRLRNSTEDVLKEMASASDGKIQYEFVNPVKNATTEEEKQNIYIELSQKGLLGTNLKVQGEDNYKEQIIFPCMLVSIDGKSFPINILEHQIGYSAEEKLNHSVIGLEYKIANAIKKLTDTKKYTIAVLQGHGEYIPDQVFDISRILEESKYQIQIVDVSQKIKSSQGDSLGTWIPPNTDLLIIARPTESFSEVEKYRIDQYVMHGGKILWALDAMDARTEYLKNAENLFMAKGYELNLDDLLFKYGVRINKNLVQDAQQSAPIPLIDNNSREPMLFPWIYTPLLTPSSGHAIGKNLDPVYSQYASSIDTIQNEVKKYVILSTSQYGRALPEPVRVHLAAIKEKQDFKYFKQPYLPVGVLLEGKFPSLFKNRLGNEFVQQATALGIQPKYESVPTKMIVLADADIIRNDVSPKGEAFPIGYDPYSQQTFANRDFVLNCIEYLLDGNNLLEARNKEIKVRLLDAQKIKTEKTKWQVINLVVPCILILLFALIYQYIRRRRWTIMN